MRVAPAIVAIVTCLSAAAQEDEPRYQPEATEAIAAMAEAASKIQDYTMLLVKRELFGKELDDEETLVVKWQRPQRIYLLEIEGPREGQEVLYATGWNKDRIKVHKGSFPDLTLNLDPYGTLAMSRAHHAVPEVSLVRFVDLVVDNVRRAQAKNVGSAKVVGRDVLWGRPARKLEFTAPPTGKSPTLAKGETLWDIARATGQDMYVILHANRARRWRQADHPEPGDAVIVPEFYAGRLVLWLDDELRLPIQADLYDHEGNLYEHYEHRDLKVNVGLGPQDFDPKNPDYRF
jgi:outer membrane lipoprotein-sorting protein